MPRKIEQLNELFKTNLANIISQKIELNDYLITITYVKISSDLQWAKIGISVLPDKYFGSALKKLRSLNNFFVKILSKKINIRKFPKLCWIADSTEKEAAELEKIINKL